MEGVSKWCTMDRAFSESRNAPTVSKPLAERSEGQGAARGHAHIKGMSRFAMISCGVWKWHQ